MANQAGDLIDIIAKRVRDTSNTAHTRAFVRDLLDRAQVLLNGRTQSVLQTTNLATTAYQVLYSVETDLTTTIEVTGVRDQNRPLDRAEWRTLRRLSPTWRVDASEDPTQWAPIGRSLFLLSPAPTDGRTVEVIGTKITDALSLDTTVLELEAEKEDMLMDMVTAMLLARQRDLDQIKPVMDQLSAKLGLQPTDIRQQRRTET